jgi:GNAT superfamily N-acetyltransferase
LPVSKLLSRFFNSLLETQWAFAPIGITSVLTPMARSSYFRKMTDQEILTCLDAERQVVADADTELERTPYVVRAIGKPGFWSGVVYSRFSPQEAEEIIENQINYFNRLRRSFEWKVYSHDQPSDLLARLQSRGFKIGEEEALMVLSLDKLPSALLAPAPEGISAVPITDEQGIEDFLDLESAIWGNLRTTRAFLLGNLRDPTQPDLAFIAYSNEKPIGYGRVTAMLESQFAGLWGGSVLPEFRGRGVYRALLSARIQHARRCESVRYLRADALPTSRPILERYGFRRVASTWPAEWIVDGNVTTNANPREIPPQPA